MKNIKQITMFVVLLLVFASCGDDHKNAPYGDKDGTPPGEITDVTIENINGGAVIRYKTPADVDLLYVKAVFNNSRGGQQEVRASMYTDSLIVEGIANTEKRDVNLYAVDRLENHSKAVTVSIEPLISPVAQVRNTLEPIPSFGGFKLDYKNQNRTPLSVYIYRWVEEIKKFEVYDVFSSNQEEGRLTIKGLESKPTKFAAFVKDKWENNSDTLFFELEPWRESVLDKEKFKHVKVLNDVDWNLHGGHPTKLWDGSIGSFNFGHTAYPIAFPHAFTVDLNVGVRLSQIQFWQRQENEALFYAHGAPKIVNLYGCEDGKNLEDPNNWVVLYSGELKKPSGGSSSDPNMQEDVEEVRRGHILECNQDVPFIRYFRFQSMASWSGMECSVVSEITLWGDIQDK